MTPKQITLVQSTWAQVVPIADTAASLFYTRLFELDPALKPLFKSDINVQGKKLMQMITSVVNGLTRIEEIVPTVEALGRRHIGYGVKDEHYETVGDALLWTLERGLGDAFTAEVEEAWSDSYKMLATTMKSAAATLA